MPASSPDGPALDRALAAANRLKPGTWESVEALSVLAVAGQGSALPASPPLTADVQDRKDAPVGMPPRSGRERCGLGGGVEWSQTAGWERSHMSSVTIRGPSGPPGAGRGRRPQVGVLPLGANSSGARRVKGGEAAAGNP